MELILFEKGATVMGDATQEMSLWLDLERDGGMIKKGVMVVEIGYNDLGPATVDLAFQSALSFSNEYFYDVETIVGIADNDGVCAKAVVIDGCVGRYLRWKAAVTGTPTTAVAFKMVFMPTDWLLTPDDVRSLILEAIGR